MSLEYGNRSLFVDSPELELTSITGQETISALFQFELELVSENMNLDANDFIGEQISFGVNEGDFSIEKVYSGFIQQLVAGPVLESGNRYYKMTIVPNLWLLTQSSACRVYQDKAAKDIIADVLKQCAVKIDVRYSLTGAYAKREYCVQYQETDFNFISRLMEEEGMFYYFEYSSDKHTLVIGDSPQSYVVFEKNKLSHFNEAAIAEQISDWTEHTAFHPGQWEVESYDFTKVTVLNGTVKGNKLKSAIYNKVTKYDFVSKVKDKADIDHLTKMRMEADEASHKYISASSNYLSPVCAGVFELSDHGVKELVGSSYVITSIRYSISEGENYIGGSSAVEIYNDFVCMPDNIAFRPQRTAIKPQIHGLLTAKVTSDSKDGPLIDNGGRIMVQMNWEFGKNKKHTADKCWVRVAQMNAGPGWGSVYYPDKDQEVLVSFVDGDPDSPIVIGSVYNGNNKPPYGEDSKNATQFGIKTSNGNEFVMENKKDKEEIYFKAKKDLMTEVDNEETKTVKKDKTLTIKEGNYSETLEKGNSETTLKQGNQKVTLDKGDLDISLSKGDYTAKMSAGSTLIESGKAIEFKVGGNSIKIDAKGITLKTATSSLALDSKGANLKGLQVDIKGDTTLKAEGGVSAELKGGVQAKIEGSAMVEVKGGAMASISGAIAKIN